MDLTTRELDGLVTWTLIRAAHRAQRELTQVFADHGLSPVQFGVLSHLATGEAFTQARLAREVLVRPQSLSGVIDGLVARGLVARGEDRGKGRRNPLVLTPAGHDLLEVVWPRLQDANRPDHLGLAPAEAAALNEVLLRLLHPPRDGGDGGGSGDGG